MGCKTNGKTQKISAVAVGTCFACPGGKALLPPHRTQGRGGGGVASGCVKNTGGGGGRDALEGGGYPPPLQGAQPMPGHCIPGAKCQLQWHL